MRRAPDRRAVLMRGNRCRARDRARTGAATVELAICLPIIMTLVLAAIECCNMIFAQQALHVAAYEGVRVAIQPASTSTLTQSTAQAMLTTHAVNGTTIASSPSDVSLAIKGQQITVTISAACDSNRYSPSFFFGGRTLQAKCVMVKE